MNIRYKIYIYKHKNETKDVKKTDKKQGSNTESKQIMKSGVHRGYGGGRWKKKKREATGLDCGVDVGFQFLFPKFFTPLAVEGDGDFYTLYWEDG